MATDPKTLETALIEMISGLTPETKKILIDDKKEVFKSIIKNIATEKASFDSLNPSLKNIFRAFKLSPIEQTCAVIIAQDPYPGKGDADGLAFSGGRGTIPASLLNIFKCLVNKKLLSKIPKTGKLDKIASQGVLLLNVALTTKQGASKQHLTLWEPYTDYLIRTISSINSKIVWVLLGKEAQAKATLLHPQSHRLIWGHPSPINAINSDASNPKAFINCDCFNSLNLFAKKIDWEVLNDEVETPDQTKQRIIPNKSYRFKSDEMKAKILTDEVFIFTDGASYMNGKPDCLSSYAFLIITRSGDMIAEGSGIVNGNAQSNNRGEISGILHGLELYCEMLSSAQPHPTQPHPTQPHPVQSTQTQEKHHPTQEKQRPMFNVKPFIITDSQYCTMTINEYFDTWLANDMLSARKNIDLFEPVYTMSHGFFTIKQEKIKLFDKAEYIHMNSHQTKPDAPETSFEYFKWKYNDHVDKLCTEVLAEFRK